MKKSADLLIIGGGIMGLMTAYYASLLGKKIIILEKRTIGNKEAGSFSYTRSMRSDYLDPFYSRLAFQSERMWDELEKLSDEQFVFRSKLLNIADKRITKDFGKTYGAKSYGVLSKIGIPARKLNKQKLKKEYPQIKADIGWEDKTAGTLYLPPITNLLLKLLKKNKVKIIEKQNIVGVEENDSSVLIKAGNRMYTADSLVITSGIWTNEVLRLIKNSKIQFPIISDRPQQCKYFVLNNKLKQMFRPEKFPILAYLDVGIYCHPEIVGRTKGMKIGFYNPPDFLKVQSKINNIEDFVRYCLPILKDAKSKDVTDADQCFYELVEDDEFILGKVPNSKRIFVGAGWRGTGYKFAPIVGKILSQLSLQEGTIYDISRFSPDRFTKKKGIDKI